ncbi:hypothetical protein ACU4GD_27940 [Cupriavidus basilensis]
MSRANRDKKLLDALKKECDEALRLLEIEKERCRLGGVDGTHLQRLNLQYSDAYRKYKALSDALGHGSVPGSK